MYHENHVTTGIFSFGNCHPNSTSEYKSEYQICLLFLQVLPTTAISDLFSTYTEYTINDEWINYSFSKNV